jgi:hypothetical protein
VVVHDVRAGLLPHRLAVDAEEERRVFHVAITRCSHSVTVVAGEPPSPFVAELTEEWTASRAPVRTKPGAATAAAPPVEAPARSARPARNEATVVASVGLEVDRGGHRGPVVAIDSEGVLIEIGQARMRVPFGSMVRTGGRSARLVPQPPSETAVASIRDALRAWRLDKSRELGKPAFVIFSDATLDGIATTAPASMAALAKVKGIGPAKLDAYGDEILAVVEELGDA